MLAPILALRLSLLRLFTSPSATSPPVFYLPTALPSLRDGVSASLYFILQTFFAHINCDTLQAFQQVMTVSHGTAVKTFDRTSSPPATVHIQTPVDVDENFSGESNDNFQETMQVVPKHIIDASSSITGTRRAARKPGRPATYVFDKPDDQLSEKERKLKVSIEKRRLRQNRSYHRRKKVRKQQETTSAISGPSQSATALQSVLASAAADPATSLQLPLSSPAAAASFAAAAAAIAAVADPLGSSTQTSHSQSTLPLPKFIPGFAQNPLDLLASATASGVDSSSVSLSPTLGPPTLPYSPVTSAVKTDRVHPVDMANLVAPFGHNIDLVPTISQDANGIITSIEPPIELDVTKPPADEISSFSLGLGSSGAQNTFTEENEDPTDELVKSALVAAKEYANRPLNLRDIVDQETELRRMTGIKKIVFDNLRSKYVAMAPNMQSAIRHFIIFPRTFNLKAATAIAGLDDSQDAQLVSMQGMLNSLIETNFIITDKGRYELNEAARLFLNEDSSVLNDNISGSTYQVAQERFIDHYRRQLKQMLDDDIHRIGWLREQAMALYDSERENMEFSEYLLNGRNSDLRQFLSAGITVMRYCVSATNRERLLLKALSEDETSTEDIMKSLGRTSSSVLDVSSAHELESNRSKEQDKHYRARLFLALSEAYFDQLKMKEAELPLLKALKLMGDLKPNSGNSSTIVDSVLVLLLLSNLRLATDRIREARENCVKALRILAEAGLGRSTFGINAMSNLVTIYLMEGQKEKAKAVSGRLLDTLNTMRYTGMPIYADALGVCGMLSMAEGDYKEAERQYARALETVGKWGSKDWTGIPVQHCLDLDLWLMEGLAEALRRQGKEQDAQVLEQRAAEDRESRGLPRHVSLQHLMSDARAEVNSSGIIRSLSSVRHIY